MKSLLCHAFGIRGCRYLATRYEKGEIIFELEPEAEPRAPEGQKLVRRGFRWRKVRAVSIGFKPVWLRVKVQRWFNTTTGEEFEHSPLCRAVHENLPAAWADDRGLRPVHDPLRRGALAAALL